MDITILAEVRTKKQMKGRVYYYQGNFFQSLTLAKKDEVRARRAITDFKIANRDMINADRSRPGYQTLVELHDEQTGRINA